MNPTKKIARIAGVLYLIYIAASIIGNEFGRFVSVEAPATVSHIMAHEALFRIGLVISLFSVVSFVLAVWALYVLLKPVGQNLALLFLALNLSGFAMWCSSTLNLFAGSLLLSEAGYLQVLPPDQLQAQAILLINVYKLGYVIAQIPYGIWLFPLGYLVVRSGFLPRILGILLLVDGIGLLIYVLQRFLLPGYAAVSYPCMVVSFVAELSLALWLSVNGVKDQKPILADAQR